MSAIVKTATIPYLNPPRLRLSDGKASTDVLTATEEQLAEISEETLERLKERVQQIATAVEPIDCNESTHQKNEEPESERSVAEATKRIVEQVLERSGAMAPFVLLFAGSETNHHVDELSARVAAELCDISESRVLLIDSDDAHGNLTVAAGQKNVAGMTDIIEYDQDWRSNLLRNQSTNLDFIPIGKGTFGRWNQLELIRKAVREIKSEYQFVCVSGGSAHSKAAKLWAHVCDGSFLLVSVVHSNGTVAKSAVAELKSSGARLLGCVVTDVDDS